MKQEKFSIPILDCFKKKNLIVTYDNKIRAYLNAPKYIGLHFGAQQEIYKCKLWTGWWDVCETSPSLGVHFSHTHFKRKEKQTQRGTLGGPNPI